MTKFNIITMNDLFQQNLLQGDAYYQKIQRLGNQVMKLRIIDSLL